MTRFRFARFSLVLPFTFLLSAFGQSGGTFVIKQSTVAGGGGTSSGATLTATGTVGQPAAGGNLTGGTFVVRGGFWTSALTPTAAHVTVGGRVVTSDGSGIRNVRMTLEGPSLTRPMVAVTNAFGDFSFDSVEVGQGYVVSVASKRYGFGTSSQFIFVQDSISDILFVAGWQN